MDKFSKVQTVQKVNSEKDKNLIYQGEYLKIFNDNGFEFVDEKDMIIILPYFKDDGYILLRSEPIPSYSYKYRFTTQYVNKTHFITAISGGIEKGENPVQTLRRELYEKTGISISELYQFHIEGPFFVSKGNSAQYFTALLELNYNDYRQVRVNPIGDGSIEEKNSKNIKVSLGDISELWISDTITELMLMKLKHEYKI